MLHIYLSNHLENLSVMLSKVLQHTFDSVLDCQHILVQNKGMQHWLLMMLAKQNGIAMNLKFEPPAGAIWSILRELDPSLSKESPYKSSIMTWRIDKLLADEQLIADPVFDTIRNYWIEEGKTKAVKRFQLAKTISDLFEQYQIFRPDWIMKWSDGDYVMPNTDTHVWQARLWHELVKQNPRHPVAEMLRLQAIIAQEDVFRPKQRILFGFNSLPPLWLDFFALLAEKQDMHLFLLSPCNEYWQDIQSDKQLLRQRVTWLDHQTDLDSQFYDLRNPLLACFGQHGQAFLKLLYTKPQNEISAFQTPKRNSLLHCVQQDILTLTDRGESPEANLIDDSIIFTSSHSALREVQALHDWLLDQFAENSALTPKDILVMCPSVEDYAPYIQAVFNQHGVDNKTAIPSSIADRSFSFDMPLIQLFSQMLSLPEQRFTVNQVIEWLSTPYIQAKFGFETQDIDTISLWLKNAAIHWGIDGEQKSQFDLPANDDYTWHQGLKRLLLGYAHGDEAIVTDDDLLLLPDIEGDHAVLLGKLMYFIETLAMHEVQVTKNKPLKQWLIYLNQLVGDLFELADDSSLEYRTLLSAIESLENNCVLAEIDTPIEHSIIVEYFEQAFNQPLQSQHFMTGQVTFCSLIPMRSIPFKIIVLLGMNDGDFPRLKAASSLDLLANDKPRLGDRSRRSDDRYLFLECLLSAREKLYISYQGNQVRDNAERQPSSILLEMLAYLKKAYHFETSEIKRTALQAFDTGQYLVNQPKSYQTGWLNLIKRSLQVKSDDMATICNVTDEINIGQMVSYYTNPAKFYAENTLNLTFYDVTKALSDSEPFDTDHLTRYQFQQELVQGHIRGEEPDKFIEQIKMSGQLPNNPLIDNLVDDWQRVAKQYASNLSQQGINNVELLPGQHLCEIKQNNYLIKGYLPIVSGLVDDAGCRIQLLWRLADAKAKDIMNLYLLHLLANTQEPTLSKGIHRDSKKEQGKNITFNPIDQQQACSELAKLVNQFIQGSHSAELVDFEIAQVHFAKDRKKQLKPFTQNSFETIWQPSRGAGLCDDPYRQYFWPKVPQWQSAWSDNIMDLYKGLFDNLTISHYEISGVVE
ncbi:exodeoxyribonuclease V subunit gamma [Catenovulum sp. SM1970]|uniref:exodeoxyribonuclease V subunit gamma n=1 Tax=Marinifaba aquimaris TaxID=2741323 RepID=UPI001573E18D|nr:exodeoxyribonuclease V subunit gamma [Marinifaba aquimaris]NTS78560.1 exodeoxyribonuclease V subunit gamma [Marinifaba aquimaris]